MLSFSSSNLIMCDCEVPVKFHLFCVQVGQNLTIFYRFFFSSTCLRGYCIMWHGWGPRDIGHHPEFHSTAHLTDSLQYYHQKIIIILSWYHCVQSCYLVKIQPLAFAVTSYSRKTNISLCSYLIYLSKTFLFKSKSWWEKLKRKKLATESKNAHNWVYFVLFIRASSSQLAAGKEDLAHILEHCQLSFCTVPSDWLQQIFAGNRKLIFGTV